MNFQPTSDSQFQEVSPPTTPQFHAVPPTYTPSNPLKASPDNPILHRLRFNGNAGDYFKIWIVNLFLTIITLGIYSPWAKVRRLRYFYGNTMLDGRTFDFTANPKRILIGRLIAIAFYIAYNITTGLQYVELASILFVILLVAMPWLMHSSMRFHARNSQYNNVKFSFKGKLLKLYGLFILSAILSTISFGLLMPLIMWLFKKYQFDNTHFGLLKFDLKTTIGDLYKATILPILAIIGILIGIGVMGFGAMDTLNSDAGDVAGLMTFFMLVTVAYLAVLTLFPIMQGLIYRAIWSKLSLGNDFRFQLIDFSPYKYAFIIITNYLIIGFSMGLAYPFTQVRLHNYKMRTLGILATADLESFATPTAEYISALGEEVSDIFDFDLSW